MSLGHPMGKKGMRYRVERITGTDGGCCLLSMRYLTEIRQIIRIIRKEDKTQESGKPCCPV